MTIDEVLAYLDPKGARGEGITMQLSEPAARFLYECAAEAPQAGWVVELGTLMGASAAVLCAAVGDGRVVTIDNYAYDKGGLVSERQTRSRLARLGFHPRIICGDCMDVPGFVGRVACLFVDCLHEEKYFVRQMEAWGPMLFEGSVVVCHDYGRERFPTLTKAIDETLTDSRYEKIGLQSFTLAFRKVG